MRAFYLLFFVVFFSCKKDDSSTPPESPKSTLDSGLVAYYPFAGNANDSSSYKNHAVVYGATKTTDRYGNANSAYYFDGISAYMRAPYSKSLDLTKDFSISVWIKPEFVMPSYGDKTCIVGYGDEQSGRDPYFLYYNVLGSYVHVGTDRFDNYRDSLSTLASHFSNIWVNVTSTWSLSSATLKIYLNGQLAASREYPQTTKEINYSTEGFVLEIGGVVGKYSFYKGAIDEVRIYNREITAKEASELVFPEN